MTSGQRKKQARCFVVNGWVVVYAETTLKRLPRGTFQQVKVKAIAWPDWLLAWPSECDSLIVQELNVG